MPNNDTIPSWDETVEVKTSVPSFDETTPVKKKDEPISFGVSESSALPSASTETSTETVSVEQPQTKIDFDKFKKNIDFYKASKDIIPSYKDQFKEQQNKEAIAVEKSQQKVLAAEQYANEISQRTGWSIEDVKQITGFNEFLKEVNPLAPTKPQESYAASPLRGLYDETANILHTIGGASTKFKEALGFNPPANNLFSDLGDVFKTASNTLQNAPDNAVGDMLYNIGAISADIGFSSAMPNIPLAGMSVGGVTIAKQVPKFPLFLGAKEGTNAYVESDNPLEPIKKGVGGFVEGLKYEMLGVPAKAIGEVMSKAATSEMLGETASAVASGLLFGTDASLEEYASTGNLSSRTFLSNFGIGAGFGISKIKTELLKGMQDKAESNFFNATPEQIKQSIDAPKTKQDLRTEAISLRQKAFKTEGQERNQYLLAATMADRTADIKAVADDILTDKQKYIEGINKDETLSPERKQEVLDLVENTHKYNDFKQKEEPMAPVVEEVKTKQKQEPVVVEEAKVEPTNEPAVVTYAKQTEIKPKEAVSETVEQRFTKEAPIVPPEQKEGLKQPKPPKPIEQMSSEEIRSFSDEVKQHEKNIYSVVFGEQADKFKQLERSSNNPQKSREQLKAIDEEMQQMIDALPKEKRDVWDGEAEYDAAELRDMSRMVGFVEESENIGELSSSLKNPLMTFSKNKNNKQTLAIFNAAARKAQELGISTEELIGQTSKLIAKEFKDPQDAIDVVKSALEAISQPTTQQKEQPVLVEPTIEVKQQTQVTDEKSNKSGGEKTIQGRKEKLLEKSKQADVLLSEGLSDIADLLGTKLSLTGEQRVKVKDAVRKVAKGLVLKGEVKIEELAMAIKDYFSKAGHDISDELINETLKEEGYAKSNGRGSEKGSQQAQGVVEGTEGQVRLRNDEQTRGNEGEQSSKEVKQRGLQENTFKKTGGVWKKIAEEVPTYYNVRHEQKAINEAVSWLEGKDDVTIQRMLESNKNGTSYQRMDRRMIYMIGLKNEMNKLISEGNNEAAETAWQNIIKIQEAAAKEATEAGWTVQSIAKFKRLDDTAAIWVVNREIQKQNQAKFPQVDIAKLKESSQKTNDVSKKLSNEAIEDPKLNEVVKTIADKNKGKKQTQTYSEKAKEVADKLRKVKSSNWGITLAADPISSVGIGVLDGAIEVTAKSIEISGNIADSIQKGINKIKRSDWYKGLKADQKRKIERQFEVNVKKDLGVENLNKDQIEKYLRVEMRDMEVSLKDVIKKHWADVNSLGISLSERIVSDLGLSEADAKLVENTIHDIIKKKLSDQLDSKMFDVDIPKSKAQKEIFVDKMGQLLMMGNLNDQSFREYFAEKFGLKPDLTSDQAALIMNLNKAVVETKDMGVFGDVVANEFAREIDKLIPKTRTQELLGGMIGLDYANALSGVTTHYINMKSVFLNLLAQPIMDVSRFEDWVDATRRGKVMDLPIFDVFNAWNDFAKSMGHGTTDLADIMKSGDLRAMHKYVSEVKSIANLNVPELERHVSGIDRFKPLRIKTKIGGKEKEVDVNVANYMKMVGRALAAEDAFNNRGFEAIALTEALRNKMRKEGYSSQEIKDQINRQVYGTKLTEEQVAEVDAQLQKEKQDMEKLGFVTDKFKDNRRRLEIIREKYLDLDGEELLDLKEVAKGNVFNDTRGGVVNSVMSSISRLANRNLFTKLTIMPHFMFFRIAGNIGDFMIDTIPAYGTLRAEGYTPSTIVATYMKNKADGMVTGKNMVNSIFGKRASVSELPFRTAQLGDKGSWRYKQQKDRARLGNIMLLTQIAAVAGLYAIGGDEKDEKGQPWFDVSGGRWDVKDIYQRENQLMPPYTIKMGSHKFRYGNTPILTFGMSVLGNYADMVRAGLPEDEISQRTKLMIRSFTYSLGSLTDQQLMQGFKSAANAITDLYKTGVNLKKEDETGESQQAKTIANNFTKYLVKEQMSPFTGWLPTRNNLFQQSVQAYTGTAIESRDLPSMMAYNLGIHHFTNHPALDAFGDTVDRKPGYTGIYYEPELITKDPKKWEMVRWLQTNNAYPASYYNKAERFLFEKPKSKGWLNDLFDEKKPYYSIKAPTEDEFYQMRKLSGEMLKRDLTAYKDAKFEGKSIWEIESKENTSSGKTVMQDKVSKYINEAKNQTRLYLFTWNELGKKDPVLFRKLYESKALPSYQQSVNVYKKDLSNSFYIDENGGFEIKDKRLLSDEKAASFNIDAFQEYMKLMKDFETEDPKQLRVISGEMWKQAVKLKEIMYDGE